MVQVHITILVVRLGNTAFMLNTDIKSRESSDRWVATVGRGGLRMTHLVSKPRAVYYEYIQLASDAEHSYKIHIASATHYPLVMPAMEARRWG